MRVSICTAFIIFASSFQAIAQDSECGELNEKTCGIFQAAISHWNETHENAPKALSFSYVGSRESQAFNEAVDGWNGVFEIPTSSFTNGEYENYSYINFKEQDFEGLYSAELFSRIEAMEHSVEIIWEDSGEQFVSLSLASSQWPYLLDPMLSNDLILEEGNSCYHLVVRWPWGTIRGEVLLDLVPVQGVGGLQCLRVAESWISIGSAPDPLVSEVNYMGGKCSASFAYALATPLARITANRDSVTFEVSGIGSKISGKRDCIAP